MVNMNKELGRTANGVGLLEDLCHLHVHLDHDVLLDGHLLVSHVDLVLHPLRELVLEDARNDVSNICLGRLGQFDGRLRQVLVHLRVVLVQEGPDVLDREALVPICRNGKSDEYEYKQQKEEEAY